MRIKEGILPFALTWVRFLCNFHTTSLKLHDSRRRRACGKMLLHRRHSAPNFHDWTQRNSNKIAELQTWQITSDMNYMTICPYRSSRLGILTILPTISNKCSTQIACCRSWVKSKHFNLFALSVCTWTELVCIQNILWLLVLSRESHLKGRGVPSYVGLFAHTTFCDFVFHLCEWH